MKLNDMKRDEMRCRMLLLCSFFAQLSVARLKICTRELLYQRRQSEGDQHDPTSDVSRQLHVSVNATGDSM